MPEGSDRPKTYDEKAVTAILKRASQLQASSRDDGGFGLSLAELQQIAAETGIDPRFVLIAASEVFHPEEAESNWWGGPLSYSLEWTVEGEIDEYTWEEMVAETRRHFKDTGEVRSWSNSREWAHSGQNSVQAHVTATTREGITRLTLFWSEPTMAVAAYIPLLVLSLIMLPIIFESLALTGLLAAGTWFTGFALLFLAARFFMRHLSSSKKRDLAALKERLERVAFELAASSKTSDPTSQTAQAGSPLHVDLGKEAAEEPQRRPRTRDRS